MNRKPAHARARRVNSALARAAAAVAGADRIVITAGAGMGVDSGLPDFRGAEGFWQAYPPYRALGLGFADMANPAFFASDPEFAWGFYGHRLQLYRDTVPHPGFAILRQWAHRAGGCFVVTSNVDGQFQQAGFDQEQMHEIHGSIHHLQCLQECRQGIWPNEESIDVDMETMRARRVPGCPSCGGVARPNILMFGDWGWQSARSDAQAQSFKRFMASNAADTVVIEIGAGTAIPSIRHLGEQLGWQPGCTVIRINPRESAIAAPHVGLAMAGRAALEAIAALL